MSQPVTTLLAMSCIIWSGLYESPTIQNLESQAAEETVSTPALASRHDSIESEQKTTTNILLRLDGLSAILFEERETEDVSSFLCNIIFPLKR